eukprot:CAMPEP_0174899198 /NCGR_PEP_ID=MMETSP0167-20121228/25954_1 /TAXON_ID=38298 /ORGANISM="Rhodella maculata, Strain CCMP736" /LENGTH=423 /DNA_ID=CAMNT_0016140107 /DNA_START=23 /DNA_END=1294 /DNA_ORIENTATION=-
MTSGETSQRYSPLHAIAPDIPFSHPQSPSFTTRIYPSLVVALFVLNLACFWHFTRPFTPTPFSASYPSSPDCDADLAVSPWARRVPERRLCAPRIHNYTRLAPRERSNQQAAYAATLLAIGDWGRDGRCCQNDIALVLAEEAVSARASTAVTGNASASGALNVAILNTGDNFYPAGIPTPDAPQVKTSWRDVYFSVGLPADIPWLSVLGNHDYVGVAAAQFTIPPPWTMPGPRFTQRLGVGGIIEIICIDTSPEYYTANATESAELGLGPSAAAEQWAWLVGILGTRPNGVRWRILVGHHPIVSATSIGEDQQVAGLRAALTKVLASAAEGAVHPPVDMYVCGHDHSMMHAVADIAGVGPLHVVVSGAGSKISEGEVAGRGGSEVRFVMKRQGIVRMNVDATRIVAEYLDYMGVMLYRAVVEK